MSERETQLLDLKDKHDMLDLRSSQIQQNKDEEVKNLLKQLMDLKARNKELEDRMNNDRRESELSINAHKDDKVRQADEMSRVHDARVKEIENMYKAEAKTRTSEYMVNEEKNRGTVKIGLMCFVIWFDLIVLLSMLAIFSCGI